MHILMVVENISRKMGGESGKSFYYMELLRERNIEIRVICHERVRQELNQEFAEEPEQLNKIHFIQDTWYQVLVWQIGKRFPYRIQDLIFNQIIHWITQFKARKLAKKLIAQHDIDLIFEPAPITPKGLSFMYNMKVPVVIGPLSGGLEFPPAFKYLDSKFSRLSVKLGRQFSGILHRVIPGKLKANALIIANQQTEAALPKGCQGKRYPLIESGVDMEKWLPKKYETSESNQTTRFIYVGRLVDWKGVNFLISAFQQVVEKIDAVLEIVGDGILLPELEQQVQQLGLQNRVRFNGQQPQIKVSQLLQESDVFVLPALREAGGNAILEAMATALPVIVTNWAGPAQVVDANCGILVDPDSPEQFIAGLAIAMIKLAENPQLRQQMGEYAKERLYRDYLNWDSKCDRIVEIFSETLTPEHQTSPEKTQLQQEISAA
ncbi:MAG: glycosyltransferase family 4 protein [Microcoleaceae cyanobacterium]